MKVESKEINCIYAQCKGYYFDDNYICLNRAYKDNHMKECKGESCNEREAMQMVQTQDTSKS